MPRGQQAPMSEAQRAKISAALRGRPKTSEHRANISRGQTGLKFSEERRRRAMSPNPGYRAMHQRLRQVLPAECAYCGSDQNLHVALRHDGSPSARRIGRVGCHLHVYSIKVEDYLRLCATCHQVYDWKTVRACAKARRANLQGGVTANA